MKKQGRLPEDQFVDGLVIPASAWVTAWLWCRSLKASAEKIDFKRSADLRRSMDDTLKPWPAQNGHQAFLCKEAWDKGTSGILARTFARTAPSYAQAGTLHHHIELLANGIVKSSNAGLHTTNRNLSVVFGGLLPPLLSPNIQKLNPKAWGRYYDHLAQFMSSTPPEAGQKKIHAHNLPDALIKGIGHCDKYELWPNKAVRDGVVGLHQQSLNGTNLPLPNG